MDTVSETVSAIVEELRNRGNPSSLAGMARFGINVEQVFGNSMPSIRLAGQLSERTDTSSRWIARDTLRELHRPDIIARVRKKSGL
jgi:hypothetical protein